MNKKILTIFSVAVLSTLILPSFVLGAYSYDRSPAGYEITSPVSFEISFDDYADLELTASSTYWGIFINLHLGEFDNYFSECIPITTTDHTFIMDLPVGFGTDDIFARGDVSYETCMADAQYEGIYFESNGEGVFLIVETPETPVVVGPIKAGFDEYMPDMSITSTTAYIGDLTLSSGPLLWLFMGIPLAFFVIRKTLDLLYPDKIKDRK